MQRVNHNSTTTKALLMAPVVDLWITLKNNLFKKIHLKKILLFNLKIALFLGFLYCWNHWAFLTILFSKDNTLSIEDYFFTLPINIGVLAALLPFNRLIMVISMLSIFFTSFIYTNTLIFANSKEDAWVGILMNLGAIFLFWYNGMESKQKANGVKT